MEPRAPSDIVIFDFDGTIADTMPFLTDLATGLLSERYHMSRAEATEAYVETCGLPFVKQLDIMFPDDSRNPSTVKDFENEKRNHLMEFGLFPDALPTIREIRRHNRKVCISSGSKEELIVRFLKQRNLDVDLVMGYRPGFEKGPLHFDFARKRFSTTCEHIIFIGDSLRDGLAAQRSGISFIAKTGLLGPEEFAKALPGTSVVTSLTEVLRLLGIKTARETRKKRDLSSFV